jgi:hypothetical protein
MIRLLGSGTCLGGSKTHADVNWPPWTTRCPTAAKAELSGRAAGSACLRSWRTRRTASACPVQETFSECSQPSGPRVLVACLRPGPVGHTASNNVTIRGFHERTFQAAGIGVEQQNVHALISPSRIGPPTSDRTRRFGRRWQRVVTAGEPARPAAGPTVRPGGRSSGRRPVPACICRTFGRDRDIE